MGARELWLNEQELRSDGHIIICGIDEAGRGPLAGPVYAAAVILPDNSEIAGLDDSKKLTAAKREDLFGVITENAVSYAIASASHSEIDGINILQATFLAMRRAVAQLTVKPELALIDGNADPRLSVPGKPVTGGDGKYASIAAASILAKVGRDRYMVEMADKYPHYAFDKHKGYGTKLHYDMLREYGPCEIHRITFLKKFMVNAHDGPRQ